MIRFLMVALLVAPFMKSCGGDDDVQVTTVRPAKGQVVSEFCSSSCIMCMSVRDDSAIARSQMIAHNEQLEDLCPQAAICPECYGRLLPKRQP